MVDVPNGAKPKLNKVWLIGGGIGAVVIFVYYKRARSSIVSSQTAAGSSTTDPNSQLYGTTGGPTIGGIPYSALSGLTFNPATGQYEAQPSSGAPDWQSISPTTNQDWATKAQQFATSMGFDPMAVAGALGRYLNGGTLTSTDQNILDATIARIGNTPIPLAPTTANNTNTFEQWAAANIGAPGSTYTRDDVTGAIYQITPNSPFGSRPIWLDPSEWAQVLASNPGAQASLTHYSNGILQPQNDTHPDTNATNPADWSAIYYSEPNKAGQYIPTTTVNTPAK